MDRSDDVNEQAPTSAQPSRLGYVLRALRHRNYRLFFAGQIVSLCGRFLSQVAVAWLVYRLAKESGRPLDAAWMLGLVGFAGQIPMLPLAPFAGVWVDRIDRRKLIIATQALATLQSLGLAILAYTHPVYWAIVALAAFQGLINAFDIPGRQAFLVDMVQDRADLPNAIALNSSMVHAARLIGPATAGFLIYYVGEAMCFLIDAITYGAVIAALLAMRVAPAERRRGRRSVAAELREGWAYVWHFVPVRYLLIMMALVSLTAVPAFQTLAPIFADALAGGQGRGSQTLGFIMGASGLGALGGAILLASRRSVVGLGRVIATAAGAYGLAIVAFSLSRSLPLSLLIVPVTGFAMITTFASANTVLQTLAEDEMRGRVMSFFSMAFMGMTPFGALLAGVLASRLGGRVDGASRALWVCGGVSLAAAVMFAAKLPALRRIVRPIYVQKGILPQVAAGLQTAAAGTTQREG